MAIATTTAIILGLTAASAASSATSSVRAGRQQRKLAEENATTLDQQAIDALARGEEDAGRLATETRRIQGTQRAGFSGQGVKVDTGSAADVVNDAALLGEQDQATIRLNAAREARGYKTQAQDMRRRGRIAQSEGNWQAAGTLLGTGSSLLQSRYGFGPRAGKA